MISVLLLACLAIGLCAWSCCAIAVWFVKGWVG